MKKLLYVSLATILIVLSHLIFFKKDIVVILTNEREVEITEISVKHSGGSIELPILGPKSSKKIYIEPAGESSLTIEYKDPSTKDVRVEKLDTCFAKGYAGTIEIGFDANGKVSWRDNVKLSLWATLF